VTVKKPYAVQFWRDRITVWKLGGEEGYQTGKARYATLEAAQKDADYRNLFDPVQPARVIDISKEGK
jgi:hypothetical protein